VLEDFAEEWDNPQRITRRPTDRINARDGWRCPAPGCTARELEVHHIVYQSHGGSDDASNLTSLCPFHHRMGEHGTLASVRGEAPLALDWTIGVEAVRTSYSCEQRAST
jgi:5-methylcytosine-specific restriction endonuclease McrA